MKKYFFLIYIILSANFILAQVSNYTDVFVHKENVDELRNPVFSGEIEIEGTPFLDSVFIPGDFQIRNTDYLLPMRYNIFLEAFEVKNNNDLLYINSNIVDTVLCNNSTFIFKKIGRKFKVFEILFHSSKGDVLKKHTVRLVDGSFGVPFKTDVYPHYKSENPDFYYSFNNKGLLIINSYSDVVNYFPEKKVVIKEFIKKEKLKKDKVPDLISLYKFVSEL